MKRWYTLFDATSLPYNFPYHFSDFLVLEDDGTYKLSRRAYPWSSFSYKEYVGRYEEYDNTIRLIRDKDDDILINITNTIKGKYYLSQYNKNSFYETKNDIVLTHNKITVNMVMYSGYRRLV